MPIDQLPNEIVPPTRDELREAFLRDYRFRSGDVAATEEGTLPWKEAAVVADVLLPIWEQVRRGARNIVLSEAQGAALETWARIKGLDGRTPATGATGFVVFEGASGGATIFDGDELRASDGVRYKCTATAAYLPDDLVPVTGVDTGTGTNRPPGTVLTWTAPRPGCAPTAAVWEDQDGEGLSGGRAEESDGELVERIIDAGRNPAASGNDAQYQRTAKATPGIPVQQVFTYPALFGPGTLGIVFTNKPSRSGGSRLPNAAQVAAVEAWVRDQMPADDGALFGSLVGEAVDVALGVDWSSAAKGWVDVSPWPRFYGQTPVSGPGAVVVTMAPFPTATAFTLRTANDDYTDVEQPAVGQTLAFYHQDEQRFVRKRILSVAGTGPWAITCDSSSSASDTVFVPTSGQRACPWSDSLDALVAPVLAYFDRLGPGEQFSSFADPGTRRRRSPATGDRWPHRIENRLINGVQDLSLVGDAALLEPEVPRTPTVGTPGVLSYLHELHDLAAFPIP